MSTTNIRFNTLDGGGLRVKRTAVTSDYTVRIDDHYVAVTATVEPRTITLPTANSAGAGKMYVINDESGGAAANNITVDGNGAELIDGALTKTISTNYGVLHVVSSSSDWYTVSGNTHTSSWPVISGSAGNLPSAGLVRPTPYPNYVMPRAGNLRAITAAYSSDIGNGWIIVRATVNDAQVSENELVLSASDFSATVSLNSTTFASGDRIGVDILTSDSFAPSNNSAAHVSTGIFYEFA